MKVLKVFKIIHDDKKYGSTDRNNRVTEINEILKLSHGGRTKNFEIKGIMYYVTYRHMQFWYDNRPITFKRAWRCLGYYHVQLWKCFESGGHCGFGTDIIKGRFTKKHIYKWLENQAMIYYKICDSDKKIK